MNEIILKKENIEVVKMDTEFINWVCPNCKKSNRTIEWSVISNSELWCNKCKKIISFKWKRN